MWRAFVYARREARGPRQAGLCEFKPLDGKFAPTSSSRSRTAPIDFQPREPFHPLFGAMPKTPLMLEFQITKEYLGFATHLVYLGPLWEEVLQADTRGPGSTVATWSSLYGRQADRHGRRRQHRQPTATGPARISTRPTGTPSAAWPGTPTSAATSPSEWASMTFTGNDPRLRGRVVAMMTASREAVVDYMTPLGLHHLMGHGHHYGPGPGSRTWRAGRLEPGLLPSRRADGIGFDRTARAATRWRNTRNYSLDNLVIADALLNITRRFVFIDIS
jgi:alpha-glucuronidase